MRELLTQQAETRVEGAEFQLPSSKVRWFGGGPQPSHRSQMVIGNSSTSTTIFVMIGGSGLAAYVSIFGGASLENAPIGTRVVNLFPGQNLHLFTAEPVAVLNAAPVLPVPGATDPVIRVLEVLYR